MVGHFGIGAKWAAAVLRTVYPPHCISCNAIVGTEGGLCGACWRETPFISGLVCDLCGAPLPGQDTGEAIHCDDCLSVARPWSRGRAAVAYGDNARRLVLAFKHGDRTDLARPAAVWMETAGRSLLMPDQLIVPVPLHWRRLYRRRYNQSALLAQALSTRTGQQVCPDLLVRHRFTGSQEGRNRDARFANVQDAVRLHPRRQETVAGRRILLIDDVMTSGATLASCAEVCLAAGACDVAVLVLARVVKDG